MTSEKPQSSKQVRSQYDRKPGKYERVIRPLRRFIGSAPRWIAHSFQIVWKGFVERKTRKTKYLLQGLPALICLGCTVTVATAVSLNRDDLIPDYKTAARVAVESHKIEDAQLYYRKLLSLDGGSPRTRFEYALLLLHDGEKLLEKSKLVSESGDSDGSEKMLQRGQSEVEQAHALIVQLAPVDSPGLPEAHLHLAKLMLDNPQQYLMDGDGQLDPDATRYLLHHLSVAKNGMPDDLNVQILHYRYYYGLGQYTYAATYLEEAAKTRPYLRYDLVDVYLKIGDTESASRNLKIASEHYERLVLESPKNDVARARCAAIRLRQGNFRGCLELLEFGNKIAPKDTNPYPILLAQSHVAMFDALIRAKKGPLESQLAHLRAALSHVENYAPAMSRLMALIAIEGETGKNIEIYLQKMIADNRLAGTSHFALGTKAWGKQDFETARWHYERAHEIEPEVGYIANNLAWVLSDCEPPDLDRALSIIEPVTKKYPDIATFHDTHGHILMKRREWQAAIDEFETALPYMRNNIQLHESLVLCYEQLQQTEFADKYRQSLERLNTDQKIQQRFEQKQLEFPSAPTDVNAQPNLPLPLKLPESNPSIPKKDDVKPNE